MSTIPLIRDGNVKDALRQESNWVDLLSYLQTSAQMWLEKLAASEQLAWLGRHSLRVSRAKIGQYQMPAAPEKPGMVWFRTGNPDLFVAQLISGRNERMC